MFIELFYFVDVVHGKAKFMTRFTIWNIFVVWLWNVKI